MGTWRFGLLVLCGCGRIGFGDLGADVATADAFAPLPDGCAFGPWGPVTPIGELNTLFDERDPTVREDGLEIVFAHKPNATTNFDLYHARRASPTDAWSPAQPFDALSTSMSEDGPSLSRDGLTLYYKSELGGITLWKATRASVDKDFANPAKLAGGPFTEATDPSISRDDLQLFQGKTDGTLLVSTRTQPTGEFGAPVALTAPIPTGNWQEGPSISRDGKTLYYVEELGTIFHILYATRAAVDAPFDPPAQFPPLVGGVGDWSPELAADGKTLYFMRFNNGQSDLQMIQRACL